MLVYAGVVLVAVSMLFIVVAIILVWYKTHHDKIVDRFERKGNKILTWEDIDNICKEKDYQCQNVMKIFHSATVSHSPVDGIRYYTRYPYSIFRVFTGHDGHRRTLIANRIGEIAEEGKLPLDQMDTSVSILKRLINPQREFNYTQLIAWNSLSKVACHCMPLLGDTIKKKDLLKCLAKKGIGSIGAQKFLFTLITKKDLDNKLENDIKKIIDFIFAIDNFTIKAILYYKIKTSSRLEKEKQDQLLKGVKISPRLGDFIMKFDHFSYGYTMEELTIGLKNLGFCDPPYFRDTSEARIVHTLLKDCLIEIGMPGAIYLFDEKRLNTKKNYENMALFEKDDPRRREIITAHHIEGLFKDREPEQDTLQRAHTKKEDSLEKRVDAKREGLLYFEKEIKNMANRIASPKKKAKIL
ncbi:MAG: hypothetical protein ACMUJM_03265 [bacterium]